MHSSHGNNSGSQNAAKTTSQPGFRNSCHYATERPETTTGPYVVPCSSCLFRKIINKYFAVTGGDASDGCPILSDSPLHGFEICSEISDFDHWRLE